MNVRMDSVMEFILFLSFMDDMDDVVEYLRSVRCGIEGEWNF